jgi:hypothetical protein
VHERPPVHLSPAHWLSFWQLIWQSVSAGHWIGWFSQPPSLVLQSMTHARSTQLPPIF